MPSRRVRAGMIAAAASAVFCAAQSSRAMVFVSTGDPTFNTTAPTGTFANSGWQWEGSWGGSFLATPISTHAFIGAHHIDPNLTGQNFSFDGVNYTVTGAMQIPNTDLNIYTVSGTFPTYAPIWDTSIDGQETGKTTVMIGRGTDRGVEVDYPQSGGTLRGWQWGADNHTQRWGTNIVSGIANENMTFDGKLLAIAFDQSGQPGYSGVNEAGVTAGDSSGGVFIKSGNQWKLAGLESFVDGPYSYSNGGATFSASLFDSTSFWAAWTNPNTFIDPNKFPPPNPSFAYPSRLSIVLSSIKPFLTPTWQIDNSGNWSNSSAWNTGTVPNAVDAEADLRGVISVPRTVTLNQAATVGNLYFESPASYTISGANTLTMAVSSGNAGITVYSGNHSIATPVSLASATSVNVVMSNSTLTMAGAVTSASSTAGLTKQGAGTLVLNNVRMPSLAIAGGVVHVPAGRTSATTSVLSSAPSISGGGQFDIEDNALIINYGADTTHSARDAIRNLLINGRNAPSASPGAWNGLNGIASSYANANGNGFNLAIGYADNADLAMVRGAGSYTSFGGQTVSSSTVLVQMTRGGDATMDGVVDAEDVTILGSHFMKPGSGQWVFGDFDYSGTCDATDVTTLGATFGKTSPSLSPAQMTAEFGAAFTQAFETGQSGAVPEPSSMAMLGLGSLALMAWRRRKRRR